MVFIIERVWILRKPVTRYPTRHWGPKILEYVVPVYKQVTYGHIHLSINILFNSILCGIVYYNSSTNLFKVLNLSDLI